MITTTPEFTADDVAGAYRDARTTIAALLSSFSDDQLDTTVPSCPAWNVRQLCAHMVGTCVDLGSGRFPTGLLQPWVDQHVADRADAEIRDMLDEWHDASPAYEDIIRHRKSAWALAYDVVVHEHDIRQAVGMPANRSTPGVIIALSIGCNVLGHDLGAHALDAVHLSTSQYSFTLGDGEVGLSLSLAGRVDSEFELLRLLGSRRSLRQLRLYPWSRNDWELFLPALAHMDLPITDIDE
jgi:uncharacterized protein (TIGR03083 family)